MDFSEDVISGYVLDACFLIHSRLGPGLFESVYENILAIELERMGLMVEKQAVVPVIWREELIDQGFRADLIINKKVIIEIKSIESLHPVHHKQLLTYLKLTNMKLGLLINFNEQLLKTGIKRIVNGL